MEHYRNLTAPQLTMLAASALVVGAMLVQRNTVFGAVVLAIAVAFGIGTYRKARAS